MPEPLDSRDRVLAATVRCAGRVGLGSITVDAVAHESGVSRASVYRWFPGGRDQLIDEAVTWEVGRFLTRLAEAVADAPDLRARLVRGLMFGHRAIEDHDVLQHLLRTDPGALLPQLRQTSPVVVAVLRDYLRPLLQAEQLRAGVTAEEAAEVVARLFLSLLVNQGEFDLEDEQEVGALVRDRLLGGVVT